jgi:hypothetical protein
MLVGAVAVAHTTDARCRRMMPVLRSLGDKYTDTEEQAELINAFSLVAQGRCHALAVDNVQKQSSDWCSMAMKQPTPVPHLQQTSGHELSVDAASHPLQSVC